MADILIYLIRLSQRLGVDLIAAVEEKMAINETRFPIDPEGLAAEDEPRRA